MRVGYHVCCLILHSSLAIDMENLLAQNISTSPYILANDNYVRQNIQWYCHRDRCDDIFAFYFHSTIFPIIIDAFLKHMSSDSQQYFYCKHSHLFTKNIECEMCLYQLITFCQ